MAERRMFAKSVIDSDEFLDMPLSAQALYFHLSIRADDDGFLNNARKIMRTIGANKNDLDVLLATKLIIRFSSGICVVRHWRVNNFIRSDRYKPTLFVDEASLLSIQDNGVYSLLNDGIPTVYQRYTQVSTEKNNEVKDRLEKDTSCKSCEDEDVSIPSIDDVDSYAKSIGYDSLDAEYFLDYYEKRKWQHKPGISVDWKLAVKTWQRNEMKRNGVLKNGEDYISRVEKANNKYAAFH